MGITIERTMHDHKYDPFSQRIITACWRFSTTPNQWVAEGDVSISKPPNTDTVYQRQ